MIRKFNNTFVCLKRNYSDQVKTAGNKVINTLQNVKGERNRIQTWSIHSYGDINELQLTKQRMPFITKSTEVLVKVKAASLNPIDYMMIKGYAQSVGRFWRNNSLEFPLTLGRDFSGIVLAKGQEVDNLKVGDHVYGVLPLHQQGSHAQVIVAEKSLTCVKPTDLSFVEAASVFYGGLTAWSALFLSGELCIRSPKNLKVLVTGASGGVGTVAIQMLTASGAKVIATCSSEAESLVRKLGAHKVHDYRDLNYVQNVATDGPYDIILDCANIGHEKVPQSWQYSKFITLNSPLVRNTDKYGLLGGMAVSAGDLITANVPKCANGRSIRWAFFAPFNSGVEFIHKLITDKKLQPVVHEVYEFSDVPKAFERLMEGNMRGKIIVNVE